MSKIQFNIYPYNGDNEVILTERVALHKTAYLLTSQGILLPNEVVTLTKKSF